MFPRPIEKSGPVAKTAYQAFLPVALFLWLLPLLAIFVTSIRGAKDINSGNIFGWPTEFALFENYTAVFTQSAAAQYMLNSVLITVPSVLISVTLACLAGYALAIYKFRVAVPLFFLFVAGNFIPFQILMVPVRDMSVQTGLYDTIAGQFLFHAAQSLAPSLPLSSEDTVEAAGAPAPLRSDGLRREAFCCCCG